MVPETPTLTGAVPTHITYDRYSHQKDVKEKSHCENNKNFRPKPSIYSAKKRLDRGEADFRPVMAKPLYQVSNIQNADIEGHQRPITQGVLERQPRSERWVLAPQCLPQTEAIPGVQVQEPAMAFQGHALRPEHSTKNLHQTDSSDGKGHDTRRHMVPPIFRRSPYNSSFKRRMSYKTPKSNSNTQKVWLDYKRKEIQNGTEPNLYLARHSLRSSKSHKISNNRESPNTAQSPPPDTDIADLLQERDHEDSGIRQLGGFHQPNQQTPALKNKNVTEMVQALQNRSKSKTKKVDEAQYNQMASHSSHSTELGKPCTTDCHTDRRILARVGLHSRRKKLPRNLRRYHGRILYKYPRVTNNLVCTPNDRRTVYHNTDPHRQLNSRGSSQEVLQQPISDSNDSRTCLEKSHNDELDLADSTHQRELQRDSRSAIKEHSSFHRMVFQQGRLPSYPSSRQSSPSRSICDEIESSTGDIRVPLSGSISSGGRCNGDPMEPMESPIPIPPDEASFEGFSQTIRDPVHISNTGNSQLPNQALVHGTESTPDTTYNNVSETSANSREQDGESTTGHNSCRLEVIKRIYANRLPNCKEAIEFIAEPIRKTSTATYQQKWKVFLDYIKSQNTTLDEVRSVTVINFLTYLFHRKSLKPSTIAHYRSALAVPLQLHCGIDLRVTEVNQLLRGMNLLRPKSTVTAPGWKLSTVLDFLDKESELHSEIMKMRKAAFLILLATGWRVSELQACVRDTELCRFTENGTLLIRPHPAFLAKNELRKRMTFREIKELRSDNGDISKICPVKALKEYLQTTINKPTGKLFLSPTNHDRPLTVQQLSSHISALIRLAEPGSKAKVHEVRKYAASYSFAETMIVGDLVSALEWSGPAVFYKHYFTQTETLSRPVRLPTNSK